MARTVTITADDFGISRSATDTILETIDHGPVRRVSILANGEAFEYAVQGYKKRNDHLELAVHINLTEGRPLSSPKEVPHIVTGDGRFRFSVGMLWLAYIFALPHTRSAFRAEVRKEIQAQINAVKNAVHMNTVIINGHQHVHLVPLVADILASMPEVASLRRIHEPLYFAGLGSSLHFLVRPVMGLLSSRISLASIPGNDWFIGFTYMGHMTAILVQEGLSLITNGSVEILFHPGRVDENELRGWRNQKWYKSPDRVREFDELFCGRVDPILDTPYSGSVSLFGRLVRFFIAGSTASLVQIIVLYILTEYAGIWYLHSTVLGWVIGFITSFILQRFWTFNDTAATGTTRKIAWYLVLQGMNAFLNITGMYILVSVLFVWYLPAQVFVALVLAFWSYFISRYLIFPPGEIFPLYVAPESEYVRKTYDTLVTGLPNGYTNFRWDATEVSRFHYRQSRRALLYALRFVPKNLARVLEVGGGAGAWTPFFAGKAREVDFLDISEKMIEEAKISLASFKNIQFLHNNFLTWEPEPSAYDLVVSIRNIEYMNDKRTALSRMSRGLRNGGWLVLSTKSPEFDWKGYFKNKTLHGGQITIIELKKLLQESGFIVRYIYPAIIGKKICYAPARLLWDSMQWFLLIIPQFLMPTKIVKYFTESFLIVAEKV